MPITATYHDLRAADRSGRFVDVLYGQQGDAITVQDGAVSAPVVSTGLYRIRAEGDVTLRIGVELEDAAGGEPWNDSTVEIRYLRAGERIAVDARSPPLG